MNCQLPAISLGGLRRLTDDCGILQHSILSVPARKHGYCLDDNARALILMHRLPGPDDDERRRLSLIFASFLEDAWNEQKGYFRNFMSYGRAWLEDEGSEDCFGRAFWALATTAASCKDGNLRGWACDLLDRVMPQIHKVSWIRSDAFLLIGLAQLVNTPKETDLTRTIMWEKAHRLARRFVDNASDEWSWFEDHLTYDNARISEALIRSALALHDHKFAEYGLESLKWLCKRQTSPTNCFRPVATDDFACIRSSGAIFGQQPLEAAATIDACEAAVGIEFNESWVIEASRAYEWYFGTNDSGTSLVNCDQGECFDGLMDGRLNRNQGAESVISFQLATCTMGTLYERAAGKRRS